tara:strand:- start:17 stop:2773 length:2757 start_codon:yes stop_codon:yes gene_type:complete
MSANSQVIVFQLVQIAQNSGLLKKQITKLENKIIDTGFKLIEDAGIDVDTIEQFVDIRALLRGEGVNINYGALLNPEIICAQPLTSPEQRENLTRQINDQKIQMGEVYDTMNNIALQIEAIKTPIIKLQTAIQPTADLVSTIAQIILVLKKIPAPSAAPPGVGLPLSIFNTFSSILKNLDDTVLIIAANLSLIPKALGGMVQMVNGVGSKIRGLTKILDPFLQLLTMIQSIVDLQDQCPLLTQEQIDEVGNGITSSITGSFNGVTDIAIEDNLEASLAFNANPPYFYKNFQFILQYDPDSFIINSEGKKVQKFSFPSRRIKCIRKNSTGFYDDVGGGGSVVVYNINGGAGGGDAVESNGNNIFDPLPASGTNAGLPVGEYSYTSDLRVLIAQAKFSVDVYTNNITAFTGAFISSNISSSSSSGSYSTGYSIEEGQVVSSFLPNYILYGRTSVNLNSSPTNIEFGADLLDTQGQSFGTGVELESYIHSGTLQVNKPVNLRFKTFGGTGNPIEGKPRFTEALLTFKRSAAIQDNINPFTGKIDGFDQSKIDDFEILYGRQALESLRLVNTVSRESNSSIGYATDERSIKNLKFQEKLQNVFDRYYGIDTETTFKDYNTTVTEYNYADEEYQTRTYIENREIDVKKERETTGEILEEIRDLFAKTKGLVNNNLLYISKKLFGFNKAEVANISFQSFEDKILELDKKFSSGAEYTSSGVKKTYAAGDFKQSVTNKLSSSSDYFNNENWYWTATEAIKTADTWKRQAAALGMFLFALKQFNNIYDGLYSTSASYNNGAWEAPGFGIPLIPSTVTADNEDVTIALQVTQVAAVNETINEVVGGLTILGTYTYTIEIIDSIPKIGGIKTSYPTNFTRFTIEDITPSALPTLVVGKKEDNIVNKVVFPSSNPTNTPINNTSDSNTY